MDPLEAANRRLLAERPVIGKDAWRRLLVTRLWLLGTTVLWVVGLFVPVVTTKTPESGVVARHSLASFFRPMVSGELTPGQPPWAVTLVACVVVAVLCLWGVVRGLPRAAVFVAGLLAMAVALFALMVELRSVVSIPFTPRTLDGKATFLFAGACATMGACLIPSLRHTWARSNRRPPEPAQD